MHDYFYHNLGQTLTLTAADGSDLNLQPTEELAFAGAHLYAYSYLYDKKVAATAKDVKATFTIDMKDKDGDDIYMNLWKKGEPDREDFTAKAPKTEGLTGSGRRYGVGANDRRAKPYTEFALYYNGAADADICCPSAWRSLESSFCLDI